MRILLLLIMVVSGCSVLPTPAERRQSADLLAAVNGWQATALSAAPFTLIAYAATSFRSADRLTIYIEGDGFAWLTGSLPSSDPTPRDPLALRLALAHGAGNAAYLGRPCQYIGAAIRDCAQRYWTEQRFAPEVITATGLAIDQLKVKFGATRVVLVGYSGGGAVAALLAARRSDVDHLVTVAGNLDHHAWTEYHRVQPLRGSLNAADEAGKLALVRQTHFVGGRDRVIPPRLARQLPPEILGVQATNLQVVDDFDHYCCWERDWPRLFGTKQGK